MYQNNRPYRQNPKPKKLGAPKGLLVLALLFAAAVVTIGGIVLLQKNKTGKTDNAPTPAPTATFDKKQHSLTDPASPWVVINKKRPLQPVNYAPANLRTPSVDVESATMQINDQAATALEALAKAAAGDGTDLIVVSAYRPYETQKSIYESEVRGFGQAQADRESARPGHSEHQTGWALDLGAKNGKCRIEACFADTPEGKWLAANAYKYGFIIRYAKNKEPTTGYQYEPWHIRYIGPDLATQLHTQKIQTLEEFFTLPAAPTY